MSASVMHFYRISPADMSISYLGNKHLPKCRWASPIRNYPASEDLLACLHLGCGPGMMALTVLRIPDPTNSRNDFRCEEIATIGLGKFVRHHVKYRAPTALTVLTERETYPLWGRRRALLNLCSIHSYSCRHSRFNFHQDLQYSTPRDPPHQPGSEAGCCISAAHLGVVCTTNFTTELRAHNPDAPHALPASDARRNFHSKFPPGG
jgi:hypothetical protein